MTIEQSEEKMKKVYSKRVDFLDRIFEHKKKDTPPIACPFRIIIVMQIYYITF